MCLMSRSFVNMHQIKAYCLLFLITHVDIAAPCGELSNYPIFLIYLKNIVLDTPMVTTQPIFMSKVSGERY